jgi:dihydroorotate dehydrogenase electron transfer subunit
MENIIFEICSNEMLAQGIYRLRLCGGYRDEVMPGQFVQVRLPGFYLRRPISVCDAGDGILTLIYKTVGDGTDALSRMKCGEKLDILTGLGNGYDLSRAGDAPLVLGGGVGIPPLYMLCRKLSEKGCKVTAVLGFNTSADVFYTDEFAEICERVIVSTADGSHGIRGFVTDAAADVKHTFYYSCGPKPMLDSVARVFGSAGQMSLEERMGCGFGTCMGCTVMTKSGARRVCADGPVFDAGEIYYGGCE